MQASETRLPRCWEEHIDDRVSENNQDIILFVHQDLNWIKYGKYQRKSSNIAITILGGALKSDPTHTYIPKLFNCLQLNLKEQANSHT